MSPTRSIRMRKLLLLALYLSGVSANTEKVIFLGPDNLQVPVQHPTLEDLKLGTLSPEIWSLRTHIRAEFPTNGSKYGLASWYLLRDLEEGRRYEVRICWAATQPTSFRLETFDLPTVFNDPELISSLAEYSETHQPDHMQVEEQKPRIAVQKRSKPTADDRPSSNLFLQIFAAADYYTTNQTLMKDVPPVFVDIILDPFLFNVFPRSLIPTIVYLVLLAIGASILAKYISKWFENLTRQQHTSEEKKKA